MTTLDAPATAPEPLDEALHSAWCRPPGALGWLRAVNHKTIAVRFMVTAFAFMLIGGLEAMMLRTQLLQPDGTVLSPEASNQAFTMHGPTMMFLFAVLILQALK